MDGGDVGFGGCGGEGRSADGPTLGAGAVGRSAVVEGNPSPATVRAPPPPTVLSETRAKNRSGTVVFPLSLTFTSTCRLRKGNDAEGKEREDGDDTTLKGETPPCRSDAECAAVERPPWERIGGAVQRREACHAELRPLRVGAEPAGRQITRGALVEVAEESAHK